MDTTAETKTFRGRSLDEVLPQVRSELGPDAIVIRRREGLAGGVAGFFQRSYVEVEARPSLPDEQPLELRSDRATAEGLATPGIQALVQQAAPFSDALATAADGVLAAAAREIEDAAPSAPAPAPAGLYGPQPTYQPAELPPVAAAAAEALLEPQPDGVRSCNHAPLAPTPANARLQDLTPLAPAAAAAHEAKLAAAGISASLAADIVGETVAHALPLAGTRHLKKLVRATLARRIPVLSDIGPGSRRVAFVGAGGAGKSAAVAALAKAYAQADAEVVVVALRSADGGCDLAAELEPHGVSVLAAGDAAQAERRLARRAPALTLVDTPAAGLGDRAGVAALAKDLQALGIDEVHLTLPAILSAAAADELAGALAPLGITNVALTHADQTARPGAPVELAMTTRKPMSYVCGRDSIELADAADLAQRLLP